MSMNARGFEALPLQLLVGVVIAGLTIPVVLAGLEAYEHQDLSRRAVEAVDSIVSLAQRLYLSGGGAQDLRVDLGAGTLATIEYLLLGDAPGGTFATAARYRIAGEPEVTLLSRPPVPISGGDGPLRIGSGSWTIRAHFEGSGPVWLAVVG